MRISSAVGLVLPVALLFSIAACANPERELVDRNKVLPQARAGIPSDVPERAVLGFLSPPTMEPQLWRRLGVGLPTGFTEPFEVLSSDIPPSGRYVTRIDSSKRSWSRDELADVDLYRIAFASAHQLEGAVFAYPRSARELTGRYERIGDHDLDKVVWFERLDAGIDPRILGLSGLHPPGYSLLDDMPCEWEELRTAASPETGRLFVGLPSGHGGTPRPHVHWLRATRKVSLVPDGSVVGWIPGSTGEPPPGFEVTGRPSIWMRCFQRGR